MLTTNRLKQLFLFAFFVLFTFNLHAQDAIKWADDGNSYYGIKQGELYQYTMPGQVSRKLVSKEQLTPSGQNNPLDINFFSIAPDGKKLLIYTNAQRVWRINTRGDYWILDLSSNQLRKLGKDQPPASLMFAKISPDGSSVAYVSENNVYVENIATGHIKGLTNNGTLKFFNGTFDWVYEEEFACRDGIRWSPDSKAVLYWQIDARKTRDYYMINNTDSVYSRIIPVEYPKAGERPSSCRLGIADVANGQTTWLDIPGDPREHYVVRAEFIPGTFDILLQQLNRKQNKSVIFRANGSNGIASPIYSENDEAWIDVFTPASSENAYTVDFKHTFQWLNGGSEFLWESEKDGWRHAYRISTDGKKETLVTPGNFDIISIKHIDSQGGYLYYLASPSNATQKYLYRTKTDGKSKAELLTPLSQEGTHNYSISPNGKFAQHSFSNSNTMEVVENIVLPSHKPVNKNQSIDSRLKSLPGEKSTEFFKVKTVDGVEMDGWMVKPKYFDASKKYPVVFYVYTEPWGQNVKDTYGVSQNPVYAGNMSEDGYIYISLDNRGTPVPKGRAWRKAIYRKFGQINIRDQAMAAKEILKWNFVDADRIAVWGWSGGGAATLNLMFQYPEIYKTGIAISAVTNLLTYDNIYQERYTGLPQENMEDYIKGSPITHAKNLSGNLLYIHGTGDDNVHFQNAEMLVNELVKYKKQFQYMAYPNRTHHLTEGEGTPEHLAILYTKFLQDHCPPGAR
jgi:dipeptidyl-peptidase-4